MICKQISLCFLLFYCLQKHANLPVFCVQLSSNNKLIIISFLLDPSCEVGTNLERFCYQIHPVLPGDQVDLACLNLNMQILDTDDRYDMKLSICPVPINYSPTSITFYLFHNVCFQYYSRCYHIKKYIYDTYIYPN